MHIKTLRYHFYLFDETKDETFVSIFVLGDLDSIAIHCWVIVNYKTSLQRAICECLSKCKIDSSWNLFYS